MKISDILESVQFTILLGRNGSGKSTMLRAFDTTSQYTTKYISPERGGVLVYSASVVQNITNSDSWLRNNRRKNQSSDFRQQSYAQLGRLELLVLREIEKDQDRRRDTSYTFDSTLAAVNKLLPAIELRRSDRGFAVHNKEGQPIPEDQLSSGEAELIALAIEVLVFSREPTENKLLLLDEPDVHLHPDLQQRFIGFVERVAVDSGFKAAVATHSTAIIGAFSKNADLRIVPVTAPNQSDFKPFSYSPICHDILPVFGAHPLSTQFNKSPVLLVEGEDDKRVFDQLVRTSGGRFVFTPCVVGTVDEMNQWERWLSEFLPSIYDDPKGYSIRDLDESSQCHIDDIGCVVRTRLNCYAIENLLLTDECLQMHGHTASEFGTLIMEWVDQRPDHPASASLRDLLERFDYRRIVKIKGARNVLVALLGTQKPWEVVVGQLLARQLTDWTPAASRNSLQDYLGPNVISKLFRSCSA
jgi:ABC-type branched-subunit amino acid transport system ATPase component